MSENLDDRLSTIYRLAVSLCQKIENDFYKILLGDKHVHHDKILEVMVLGITHLTLSMVEKKGLNIFQESFNSALKRYAEHFMQKHSLISNVDFEFFFSTRLHENTETLNELVYNGESVFAYDECNRVYFHPLQVPLPIKVIDPMFARKITPFIQEFIQQLEDEFERQLSHLEHFNWKL